MTVSGIDTTAPQPRINFEMFKSFQGKRVKVVGKVEQISGSMMKVRTSDDGLVEVLLKGAAPEDVYVEIDGTVEGPNILREESNVGFGNTFGMFISMHVCMYLWLRVVVGVVVVDNCFCSLQLDRLPRGTYIHPYAIMSTLGIVVWGDIHIHIHDIFCLCTYMQILRITMMCANS